VQKIKILFLGLSNFVIGKLITHHKKELKAKAASLDDDVMFLCNPLMRRALYCRAISYVSHHPTSKHQCTRLGSVDLSL